MIFLKDILQQIIPLQKQGESHNFIWQWLGEGIWCFTPKQSYEKAMVISAGIHGNETAPIELLEQIFHDLFNGNLHLKTRLLLVLGNPDAIRNGSRYIENDMNRMFLGKYAQLEKSKETQRAEQLEHLVQQFFEESKPQVQRYHYDLHTAIRSSLLPVFAIFPYQQEAYDEDVLRSLNAADMDALVFHGETGHTFTSFTQRASQVASVTLELGAAKPFGQNDLSQFNAINSVLRALLSDNILPTRTKNTVRKFKVVASILKQDDDFKLNLAEDAPNFSSFEQGQIIAAQRSGNYIAQQDHTCILFPNIHVKKGLRAGLILEEFK